MRIAVVNNFFPPRVGGSAHIADGLARHYAARGHEVLVITTAYGGGLPEEERDGLRIVRLPSWTLPETRVSFNFDITFGLKRGNYKRVGHLLDDFKPDVIHQHGQFFDLTWQSGLWARRKGVPTLLTVHTRLESPSPVGNALFRSLDATVVRPILSYIKPSRVVAIDVHFQTYLRDRYGLDSEHIEYCAVGIELDRFLDVDAGDVRARYGVEGVPVVLSLGHVIPLRDRVALVRSLPLVLQRQPDLKVLVVGGVYYSKYLELAEELGVAHAIINTGAVPKADVPALCAAADLEVHDLQGLGVGIATLEAMAAGTPAIMSVRADNWPHAPLHSGQNCVLVPLDDPPALSDAICALVEDPEYARRVGASGRQYVFDNFDFEAVGDRYLGLLADVVN